VVPAKQQLAPAQFIVDHALSIWFSVPSVGVMLRGLRLLKPNAFPTLRWSLFCGERLPRDIAEAWQRAAPNAVIENLYGPTEVTIACTLYRWNSTESPARCVDGVVPIGAPYAGLAVAVVDEALRAVAPGERGELCVRGPQVSAGYWRDAAITADRFVAMSWDSGPQNRWYRTGDLAFFDDLGELIHCGRSDDQVKLRGFRIELGEVEHALREASGADAVAVIAWPVTALGATGLVGFVAGASIDVPALDADLRRRLPDYMVPAELVRLDRMPLNANGKIDKRALRTSLEGNDGDPK
jgi:non-ribosomal peptide synthetase component F